MINDIIDNSKNQKEIKMSTDIFDTTVKLREFLFENIYFNKTAKSEEHKAEFLVNNLFNYYIDNLEKIPKFYLDIYNKNNSTKEEIVKDYISGMTDRYAIKLFKEIYVPNPWDK